MSILLRSQLRTIIETIIKEDKQDGFVDPEINFKNAIARVLEFLQKEVLLGTFNKSVPWKLREEIHDALEPVVKKIIKVR
ncbi:MAG: hypothetical protein R6U96_04735 [Promethearchaeia archaeon]